MRAGALLGEGGGEKERKGSTISYGVHFSLGKRKKDGYVTRRLSEAVVYTTFPGKEEKGGMGEERGVTIHDAELSQFLRLGKKGEKEGKKWPLQRELCLYSQNLCFAVKKGGGEKRRKKGEGRQDQEERLTTSLKLLRVEKKRERKEEGRGKT